NEFVAQRVLYAQVDREVYGSLQLISGKSRHVQCGEPLAIQPFFNARDALIVDIDVTNLMRDDGAVRINAFVFGEEANTRNAEPVNLLLLPRRNLAFEPDKATFRGQALSNFVCIKIGEHRCEQLDRFIDIDDLAWLCE